MLLRWPAVVLMASTLFLTGGCSSGSSEPYVCGGYYGLVTGTSVTIWAEGDTMGEAPLATGGVPGDSASGAWSKYAGNYSGSWRGSRHWP